MAVFVSDTAKFNTKRLPTSGKYTVPFKVMVPTTAVDSTDEQVLLLHFGPDTFFSGDDVRELVVNFPDFDSSTGHVCTIGVGDIDGVIDGSDLIAGSTSGQDGSEDLLDAVLTAPEDISNKYLIMDTTTAVSGTASAGYLEGYMVVQNGIFAKADDSLA